MNQFWEKYKKIQIIVVPVITIALLCVLTGTMVFMQEKTGEMTNQLSYLIDTNSILQSQMTNMQSNIEAALEEEASLIEKQSIEVTETDFAKGTYQVKITVVPKEYTDTTRVSVFFGTNEIPLTLNRYAYEGTAELSLDHNYDGNVAFLFVSGDKKSTEVLKDFEGLQTRLEDLLYGHIPEIPECEDGELRFDHEISYTLNTYKDYSYETLELVLTADGEELTRINLLETLGETTDEKEEDGNDIEDVFLDLFGSVTTDKEDVEVATEDMQEDTDGDTEENTEGNMQMVYGLSGTAAFKKTCEVEEGQSIRLFLRAKCENGYTLEYDLFSGVVEAEGANGFAETMDYFVGNYWIYDGKGNKLKMQ